MKKSILSIILAAVLVITNCPVDAAGRRTPDLVTYKMSSSTPIVTGYDANCDLFGQTLDSMMETWLNDASYDKVTVENSSDKAGFSSQIIFDISNQKIEYPTTTTLRVWVTQAKDNHPNLCVTGHAYRTNTITKNGKKIIQKIIFYSPVSSNEIKNTVANYKEKLSSLVDSIPSSLTTSAKLLYLHDQIAGMGDYNGNIADNNFENVNNRVYTSLGILIDGDGVCQSYAAVMNHAALAVGIPSVTVTSSNHAWNLVQVGNNWYYIDATWDDLSSTNNTRIGEINHEYFLVDHSTLSANDDSTRPHAIDADFYDIFGSITDSIRSSYPNAAPKSESNPYGIGKKMSFLNGSWYYCDKSSIYTWDGKSEYGTKTNAASGIINCCTFENTLYYAKSNGIFQYVDGINDKKLNDINASNITDMIIVGDTLKYVENGTRKVYSLAKFSTATPTPIITPTPSPSTAPTTTQTTSPAKTQAPGGATSSPATPTSTASPSMIPAETKAPNTSASPSATPVITQKPNATASPSATPAATQTPGAMSSPSATPTVTQTPNATVAPTVSPSVAPTPKGTVTPSITPSSTKAPNTPKETATPTKTSKPTSTKRPQVPDYYDDDFEDDEDNIEAEGPEDFEDDNDSTSSSKQTKKGSKIKNPKTKAVYQITGTGKNKTVEYIHSSKRNATTVNIPAKVKLNGKTYKVTSVGNGAFKGNKKLTLITIGKNVKKIGKKAFYNCKNLRYLQFNTKKLTSGSVGKKAFNGSYANPRVKTDKTKWKQYSKIFFSKGMSKKAVFIIEPVKLVI